MNAAPHFRSDPKAAALFDQHVEKGRPDVAVRAVVTMGLGVAADDVPAPHLEALKSMRPDESADFQLRYASEIANERTALRLVAGQEGARRARDEATAQATAVEREQWIAARVTELDAAWHAERLARFTEQATREAADRFDAAPLQPEPPTDSPAPARKPRLRAA